MQNPIRTLLARVNNSNETLRILCRPTHEGYQTTMGHLGHEFHMIQGPGIKAWDFHTRPLPRNHYIYRNPDFYPEQAFDLILSQERYGDLQNALNLGQKLGLPVVHIDHTEPPPNISPRDLKRLSALRADAHCFITKHNKSTWGGLPEDTVIPHGIDTDIFTPLDIPREGFGISVVNHFASRDVFCGWNIWQQVASKVRMRLIGHNPELPAGSSTSINNPTILNRELCRASFFLNTSILSPCPLSLLEAAAAGMPIVSTAHQEVPKIFTHGVNALLSNDPKELIEYCTQMQQDPEMARKMGNAAREMILANFSVKQFVNNWNTVFGKVL